ncbi:MAG: phosphoenolpyruvate carboxykinase [Gemmatimonadota bacterium]|nr:phosphoenolpyruvate carboxykinase [Gemmatimonadota bacterium]
MQHIGPAISRHGLDTQGIRGASVVRWNYTTPALYEHAIRASEGLLAGGPLVVRTGDHTGRAPKDKFVVQEPSSETRIWWGEVNRPFPRDRFEELHRRMLAYLQGRGIFVQDLYAGADPAFRIPVRVITETAWHSLFARNMFIRPPLAALADHEPAFTVLHCPGFHAEPSMDGTNSNVFVILDLGHRLVLIGGTSYAGEIKKSIFTVMNYLLPLSDVLPMHGSANVGPDGDTAVFFGLSGTGKTTLSADASRTLVGDDEHGWSDEGVFNFEGGCYAKVIRLSAEAEPEIFDTTRRFGTVLENVMVNPDTRVLDLDDDSLTENTRAAYPIDMIPNASESGMAGHPRNIVMLTADAFGVLPPVSRMTPEQAMYHFLSGYTAKLAGTEKGLGSEPKATFSACFGAPFMALHPSVYAEMLGRKIAAHDVRCWLVNTGWSGGPFGVGSRMKIAYTRAMVSAALDGRLADVETNAHPVFGVHVPVSCPGVPAEVLDPRGTWDDGEAYDAAAKELAGRFRANFAVYEDHVDDQIRAAGPRAD